MTTNHFLINGNEYPPPLKGLKYVITNNVEYQSTANGGKIVKIKGRKLYTFDNLQFGAVTASEFAQMVTDVNAVTAELVFYSIEDEAPKTITVYLDNLTYQAVTYDMSGTVAVPNLYKDVMLTIIDSGDE
jgi:hypothetical protein